MIAERPYDEYLMALLPQSADEHDALIAVIDHMLADLLDDPSQGAPAPSKAQLEEVREMRLRMLNKLNQLMAHVPTSSLKRNLS